MTKGERRTKMDRGNNSGVVGGAGVILDILGPQWNDNTKTKGSDPFVLVFLRLDETAEFGLRAIKSSE